MASLRQQRTEHVVSVGQEALSKRLPDTLADGAGIDPEIFDIVPKDASWLHRERRTADERFAIPASDLLDQVPACSFRRLTAKRELAEITPNDREFPIICVPDTMDSRKQVVDGQRREEGKAECKAALRQELRMDRFRLLTCELCSDFPGHGFTIS